ncbi:hypothetical protein [Lentilitoribacter sp. Alg239-R112]|uniref:hypothetical protein n=1 Tax=Lentilitoribacter sp. Alg239-R112 TaxID=2305987 RepID=UPI0013A6EC5E|nr:hypothetical protein [Lentilitoribacter sp. Alg239-R112]
MESRFDISDDGSVKTGILNVYEPPLDEDEAKPISEPPDSTLYRDAFEILRDEKAAPISSTNLSWSHSNLQSWKVTNQEGLSYTADVTQSADVEMEMDVRVDADDLVKQIRMLLHPTIDEMKKFILPGDDPRSAIPRESLSIDLSFCSTENVMAIHALKRVTLMQFDCNAEELINWYKVWIRVE